jgi:UDP-N-acetylmuramoylalanine--D-glutamate ligase
MTLEELALQGKQNPYGSMAAGIKSRLFDIRKEIIKESLSEFQHIEHKLEFVASIHGIEFINDSKATNVNSTWYALETVTRPIVWIAGGIDKGNDYSLVKDLVREKVKAIVCLGVNNDTIRKEFADMTENIVEIQAMSEAVRIAYHFARRGDTVLLSPACASFDLFENYEDRGNQFKHVVNNL